MKSIKLISLTILFCTVSCVSPSDIDRLQDQIDGLGSGKIATVEEQVRNIQSSITSLEAAETRLSSLVSALQEESSSLKSDLSAKEKSLGDRIDGLKKYADEELGKSKDWASATFATLKQYQDMLTELAGIKESLKELDSDVSREIEDAIAASESSMKGWVNEQFEGYYTIAQMDVKLKALSDADASAASRFESDLAAAKSKLTEAYTKAISEAIAKYDGEMTTKMAADIKTATNALQKQIDSLDGRISALEGMIQSVTIIPACTDGTVEVYDNLLYMSAIISPASAMTGLTKDDFTVYAVGIKTKAAPFSAVSVTSATIDIAAGHVTLQADLKDVLATLNNGESPSVALNVKSAKSNFTTSFVNVTVITEYVDLGLSVKWRGWNLGASKPEEYGGYYQWAGTTDVTDKSIYLDWSNCPYHTGSYDFVEWTKYILSHKSSYWGGSGTPDNKTMLDPDDDVAHAKLGEKWRMPTDTEWAELRNTGNCSWVWTNVNGINGYKVQSLKSGFTDNWIFLPAAGYRSGDCLYDLGSYGDYWSSSLYTANTTWACSMCFSSNSVFENYDFRYNGVSVRPVLE